MICKYNICDTFHHFRINGQEIHNDIRNDIRNNNRTMVIYVWLNPTYSHENDVFEHINILSGCSDDDNICTLSRNSSRHFNQLYIMFTYNDTYIPVYIYRSTIYCSEFALFLYF